MSKENVNRILDELIGSKAKGEIKMNNENEEKIDLKDEELNNVSGGNGGRNVGPDNRYPCLRANSINCPGGVEGSFYEKCSYLGTIKCVNGRIHKAYPMPYGYEYWKK